MADIVENGPHGYAHFAIGGDMKDRYVSPADPIFFLIHAWIDRNYRIWQYVYPDIAYSINGTDIDGDAITLDTVYTSLGVRPDLRLRDIIDTTQTLCYKYDY